MELTIEVIGTKPLLLNSVSLADPRDPWAKELAKLRAITSKKRTDETLDRMEYVQFRGSFYAIPEIDGIGIPCENLRQSLIQAAKISRDGTTVQRATQVTEPAVPVIYEGPKTPDELWKTRRFHLTKMIRGKGGASPSTYPMFSSWGLRVPLSLDESVLNFEDLQAIAVRAGRIEGLGAMRKLGYGRYDAIVKQS